MRPEALLFLLIVLACPLMMIFMMRGGHGSRGHQAMHEDRSERGEEPPGVEVLSLDELLLQRDAVVSEIARREGCEAPPPSEPART